MLPTQPLRDAGAALQPTEPYNHEVRRRCGGGAVVELQFEQGFARLSMRLALAQINPTIGDIGGALKLAHSALRKAQDSGADVVLFPEMALLGYPPRDLLLRDGVVEACALAVRELAASVNEALVIVGHPRRLGSSGNSKDACNSASALRAGSLVATYDKQLLPGYDVFDEDRWFAPGDRSCIVEHLGRRIGILICEDIWRARDVEGGTHLASKFEADPVARVVREGAEILCVLSASPFVMGKGARHLDQARMIARVHRVTVALCNQVGANDDLIFDGRSVLIRPDGSLAALLPSFEEAIETVDTDSGPSIEAVHEEPMCEAFSALRLGIRDYVRKTGHDETMIGLSGGIDSAVTAALATAALGPERVTGVLMPSRHTSRRSIEDAATLAGNLQIESTQTFAIEAMHHAFEDALTPLVRDRAHGIVDENVQARIRGVLLMALSNARPKSLVLATGNKSELAMGYTTLYGDMCGALSPLGDLLKTQVYELARWMNANHRACGFTGPPIPQSVIERAPTAELRPNQTDQDTLPPYEILDELIRRYVDHEEDVESICRASGCDAAFVRRVARQIDRSEYKRKQAAIILKVSPRAFGPGRPMPAAMQTG